MKGNCANECPSSQVWSKHHQSLCEQNSPAQPTENKYFKVTPPSTTTALAKTKTNVLLQTTHSRAYIHIRQSVGAGSPTSTQWKPMFLHHKLT